MKEVKLMKETDYKLCIYLGFSYCFLSFLHKGNECFPLKEVERGVSFHQCIVSALWKNPLKVWKESCHRSADRIV